MMKALILFLCLIPMLEAQFRSVYNPFTKKQDYVGEKGDKGDPGDPGIQGPVGPAGAPNTRYNFINATSFTWVHNEGTLNALYQCFDDSVSPAVEVIPNTINPVDENTVTITFGVSQAHGYCTGNFAGGSGGGNPLFANVQSGTNPNDLGIGGTLFPDGGNITANVLSPLASATTLLMTGISPPSPPGGGSGLGIPYYDLVTRKFCVRGDDGSTSCTGAPGGGSVLSFEGEGGVETLDASSAVNPVTTTGKVRAANLNNTQSGTTYTLLTGDRGKLIVGTNAASMAWTLPQAGASFPDGWCAEVVNDTSTWASDIAITPATSTINGTTVFKVGRGEYTKICSDGTNYYALALRPMIVNGSADGSYWDPWGGPFHDVSATGIVAAAPNKVYMFTAQLEKPVKISKATIRVLTGSASTHMAVAIYKDVNTKIFESSSETATSNGLILQPTFSSTILTPGLYIVAYTTDSTSNAITSINSFPATNSLWTSRPDGLKRSWSCLNTSNFTGGAIFPATCGTATNFSTTGPLIMYFEN